MISGLINNDVVSGLPVLRIEAFQFFVGCGVILLDPRQPDLDQALSVIDDELQLTSRSLVPRVSLGNICYSDSLNFISEGG